MVNRMHASDYYFVNAFVGQEAKGNPASVVFVEEFSSAEKMLAIAKDFNLPITVFIKQIDARTYSVRWFEPTGEIVFCGHGLLACIHLISGAIQDKGPFVFQYPHGQVKGFVKGALVGFTADAVWPEKQPVPDFIQQGFQNQVREYYRSTNKHLLIFESETSVEQIEPDWEALRKGDVFAMAATAQSLKYDFVSRTFFPFLPKLEDYATGSSHLTLVPYWSKRLGESGFHSFQASSRGGEFFCELRDSMVEITGRCVTFDKGTLL